VKFILHYTIYYTKEGSFFFIFLVGVVAQGSLDPIFAPIFHLTVKRMQGISTCRLKCLRNCTVLYACHVLHTHGRSFIFFFPLHAPMIFFSLFLFTLCWVWSLPTSLNRPLLDPSSDAEPEYAISGQCVGWHNLNPFSLFTLKIFVRCNHEKKLNGFVNWML